MILELIEKLLYLIVFCLIVVFYFATPSKAKSEVEVQKQREVQVQRQVQVVESKQMELIRDTFTVKHVMTKKDKEQFKKLESRSEFICLVDLSGSMGGTRLETLKKAFSNFVENLPFDAYFNIVWFGTGFKTAYPASVLMTQNQKEEVQRHINTINADMGGTNITPSLEWVLNLQPNPNCYQRFVMIFTDGGVDNTDIPMQKVVAAKDQKLKYTIIGLGDDVETTFITRMKAEVAAQYFEVKDETMTQLLNKVYS